MVSLHLRVTMMVIGDDMRRSFGLTQNDAGAWLCTCGSVLEGEELTCKSCKREQARRADEEAHRRRFDVDLARVKASFNNSAFRGDERWRAHLPAWPWARFENSAYRKRVAPALLRAYESYDGSESLVVSAKTGGGKTSLACAWLHRERERAEQAVRDGAKARGLDFMFVSGPELAGARKRWGLGSESRLVTEACEAGLLILDELGFEPASEEVFFVIDGRYRSGAPTIVTTGLPIESRDPKVETFVKRYGAALLRRLLEPGRLVEVE